MPSGDNAGATPATCLGEAQQVAIAAALPGAEEYGADRCIHPIAGAVTGRNLMHRVLIAATIASTVFAAAPFTATPAGATSPLPPTRPSVSGYSLDVSNFGGYVFSVGQAMGRLPLVYIRNGVVYRAKATSGRAVPEVEQFNADPAALIAAVQAVYDTAVEPENGFTRVPVEDAPVTLITVRTPAGARSVWIYQPTAVWDRLEDYVGAEQGAARRALAAALTKVYELDGTRRAYRPTRVEFWPDHFSVEGRNKVRLRSAPRSSGYEGCFVLPTGAIPTSAKFGDAYVLPRGGSTGVTTAVVRPVLPGEKPCLRADTTR